ncbi:hypothetical protein ACQ4LE_000890 [Meloidogyne hapla]
MKISINYIYFFKIIKLFLFIFCHFTLTFASLYSSIPPVTTQEAKFVVQIESNFTKITQFCSGTLLTNRLVVTAAHCLYREDSGFAASIRLKIGNQFYYSKEYAVRNDFIKLEEDFANFVDMALIILNTPNYYFMFDDFSQFYNIPLRSEETFAFGYGINEFRHMPKEPHKVPIKLVEGSSSDCTIDFYFSGSGKSCLGDSGGPVFSYLNTQEFSSPSFIGLSLQIASYEDNLLNNQNKRKELVYGENVNLGEEEMENCRKAKELIVLKKECIQNWLKWLVYNEKNIRRKLILKEVFNSFLWK